MKDALAEQLNEILNPDILSIEGISSVNFKPHPYTIGTKHLEYNDSMYLGESEILDMEREHGPMCAHPQCQLLYGQHTSDTVAFIKLATNVDHEDLKSELLKIADLCKSNKVDGFGFIETDQKFRIT